MAAYIYIPTGQRVECGDGKDMPAALFAPVEEQKPKPRKAAPRKRTAKTKEQ